MASCSNQENPKQQRYSEDALEELLIEANKRAVKAEDQQIRDFVDRYKWDVMVSGTGLRYFIYKQGDGEKAEAGKIAVIERSVSLLNGIELYSSAESGAFEFLIGKGGVESGLEEGILLMRVGDQAKFILPSHLAFGLVGDEDKIPPKTTLIYDVKLLNLK